MRINAYLKYMAEVDITKTQRNKRRGWYLTIKTVGNSEL